MSNSERPQQHYIIYIHGVSTRDEKFADDLINQVRKDLPAGLRERVVQVSLFWAEPAVVSILEQKSALSKVPSIASALWFQSIREAIAGAFVGDAMLYISPRGGAEIVRVIREKVERQFADFRPDLDVLHIVGHSWGTIIIFDILFGNRWTAGMPGYQHIQTIRSTVTSVDKPLKLASVHTMGSPIAVFSPLLLGGTHDSNTYARAIADKIRTQSNFRWTNYVHPGDIVAHPLGNTWANVFENLEHAKFSEVLIESDSLMQCAQCLAYIAILIIWICIFRLVLFTPSAQWPIADLPGAAAAFFLIFSLVSIATLVIGVSNLMLLEHNKKWTFLERLSELMMQLLASCWWVLLPATAGAFIWAICLSWLLSVQHHPAYLLFQLLAVFAMVLTSVIPCLAGGVFIGDVLQGIFHPALRVQFLKGPNWIAKAATTISAAVVVCFPMLFFPLVFRQAHAAYWKHPRVSTGIIQSVHLHNFNTTFPT